MIRPGRPYNSLKEYNKDTYYLREGAHIEFIGKGSAALDLIGREMTPELYQNLKSANDSNGLPLTKNAGTEDHRTGYDLPFSPHKSVSLAYFYGNDKQKEDILSSHNIAVRKVADYIERNLIQYRMSGGKVFQRTDNMVAAHFNHFVSRDLDPQLHSHLVIFNMVRNEDGKWYSLSGDMIHESRLITEMYHTELAMNLKEKGYGVEWVKCGKMTAAKISGVSDQAIEIHSKRSKAIRKREKTMMKEFPNATPEELRNMAVLDTRAPKKIVNMLAVEAACRAELTGHGIDPDTMSNLRKEVRLLTVQEKESAARKFIDLAIKHIAEREMVFTKNEVLKYALDFSRDQCGTGCLEKAFLENDSLHRIGILTDRVGGRRTKEDRFTTKELAADEKFAVQLTWEHNKQEMGIISKKEVVRFIKVYEK